ncbi:hypothetical protein SEUCBS140593_008909 [Sporothrix eucalyptigena]|uniref:Chitin-binding type-1 domain-containing protein n=1 Tax=Sporothrix eucalyptigena TaxID=1812306 RepID=A0ABP0CR18_9PEZI
MLALSIAPATTASTCNLTVTAQDGDTCASLAGTWGITVTAFLQNNPTINSCSKLTVGASYCIDAEAHPVASSKGGNNPATTSPVAGGGGSGTSPAGNKVSLDGTCGSGYTCTGSKFGTCCSAHGWCGSTTDHCGAGCQADFGSCVLPVAGNGTTTSPAGTAPPGTAPPGTTPPPTTPPLPSTTPKNVTEVTQVKTAWTTLTTTRTTTTTTTVVTTAWVTNTAYATNTAMVTKTSILPVVTVSTTTETRIQTQTQTWTALATVSTVLTSMVTTETLRNTAVVTRTTTKTRFDTSIITTITTVTLVLSVTDKAHLASMCSQTVVRGPQTAEVAAAEITAAPAVDARNIEIHQEHQVTTHTPPKILLEPCCGTEIVQCAASTPGLDDSERRSVSSMARRAAMSMPGMDVCCGALYNCL